MGIGKTAQRCCVCSVEFLGGDCVPEHAVCERCLTVIEYRAAREE